MDRVSLGGEMEQFTQVNLRRDLDMGKASGKRTKNKTQILMRVIFMPIVSMDLEYLNGNQVTFTRACINLI